MKKDIETDNKLKLVFGLTSHNEFLEKFASDSDCLQWLSQYKWEQGFVCKKCGGTNFCDGATPYSRRCTRCKHTESATAHTAFHRCRIPLTEAFDLLFQTIDKSGESTRTVAKKNDLRHMTCWRLTRKFQTCIQEGDCFKLFGKTE